VALWRDWARRAGWALIGVALLALAGWVMIRALIAQHNPDEFQRWTNWSNILALPVGAVGTALVVLEKATRRPKPMPVGDRRVERALADLAVRVGGDWADEAVRREVTRPAPVLVRWSSTGRPAASRQVVLNEAGPDWRELPLRGQLDALNREIVDAFLGLPQRRCRASCGPRTERPPGTPTATALIRPHGTLAARRRPDICWRDSARLTRL
jgi:hypothetical protein